MDRGLLDPALLVTHYVPEAEKSCFAGATVRQVLDMLVSCQFVEDYVDPESDFQRYRVATGFNPLPEGQWEWTQSVRMLRQLCNNRMYPLTLDGLERAITRAAKRVTFEVDEHEIVLHGQCSSCAS